MSAPSAWDAALPALAALLGAAALAKVARPGDTGRALRVAGLPGGPGVVRGGALAELAVAAAVLAGAGRWAAGALAVSYAGFSGFVALARVRRWPLATCGCFGEPDTPPTLTHAAACLVAAGAAGASALAGRAPGLGADVSGLGAVRAAVFVALSAVTAYAAFLVMSAGPRLGAARAALRAGPGPTPEGASR